jgi:hypothetical protein
MQQFSFWRGVGQVSDLPVDGVSDSARGQRPLQPADQEVCPTLLAIMRIAEKEAIFHLFVVFALLCG